MFGRILSVTELTLLIKEQVERVFSDVWVEGEISNLRIPSSGHLYFTLKDSSSQLKAVVFRSAHRNIPFQPADGQQVLCLGHLAVYEPRGEYQLIVDSLEPKGVGALQLAYEQLKERLKSEGLFDENRKKPLPVLPRRIGIITSPSGAVLQDMLRILDRRFPNLSILVYPVSVQGEGSAAEIVQAIEALNIQGEPDVLILARGGGSLEDLWSFNEEKVARAIAASKIPLISAVGHETDYTISDFVADLRAPTPSAAAEMVIRPKAEWKERIDLFHDRLSQAIGVYLEDRRSKCRHEARVLPLPRKKLEACYLRLDELAWRSRQAMVHLLRERRGVHRTRSLRLTSLRPDVRVRQWAVRLQGLCEKLRWQATQVLEGRREALKRSLGKLDSLSPLAVLSRGYCIARKPYTQEIIRSTGQVRAGEVLHLRLHQGGLLCQVQRTDLSRHGNPPKAPRP